MKNQNKLIKEWNLTNKVGQEVTRYRYVSPLREPTKTRTRSEAWLMGGHTAMIMVEGVVGAVMLESLEK